MKRKISVGDLPDGNIGIILLAMALSIGVIIAVVITLTEKTLTPLVVFGVFASLLIGLYFITRRVDMEVHINDRFLYVSNGKKEARVPFSSIKSVMETSGGRYSKGPDIFIKLKTRSEVGKWFQFTPIDIPQGYREEGLGPRPWLARFYPRHPIADELRRRQEEHPPGNGAA